MENETNPGPCLVVAPPRLTVSPRAGRAIVFGSGAENPHRVSRVTGGTRFVLRLGQSKLPLVSLFLCSSYHVPRLLNLAPLRRQYNILPCDLRNSN